MKRTIVWIAALLALWAAPLWAGEKDDFNEGPVTVVTAVRTEVGQWDHYVKHLRNNWKPVMEAQKQAGIILGYSVQSTRPRTPDEPNIYLVVTYPNMAAFDGLGDRAEPVAQKVTGMDREASRKANAERESMRKILGTEMIRELVLK
ncbi:MAG TPA: hypothetical protein VN581_00330 [Patescibacteria group bacterium]|nr:hypothetical protein [Patescibacteria group bacterium]